MYYNTVCRSSIRISEDVLNPLSRKLLAADQKLGGGGEEIVRFDKTQTPLPFVKHNFLPESVYHQRI